MLKHLHKHTKPTVNETNGEITLYASQDYMIGAGETLECRLGVEINKICRLYGLIKEQRDWCGTSNKTNITVETFNKLKDSTNWEFVEDGLQQGWVKEVKRKYEKFLKSNRLQLSIHNDLAKQGLIMSGNGKVYLDHEGEIKISIHNFNQLSKDNIRIGCYAGIDIFSCTTVVIKQGEPIATIELVPHSNTLMGVE